MKRLEKMHSEAALWVAQMDADRWTDADEARLQAWLAEDPMHPGALLQAQAAWHSFDALSQQKPAPVGGLGRLMQRRELLLAGAGSLMAASIAAGAVILSGNRYRTVVGEIRHLPLPDGSVATINTDSDVNVRFAGQQRTVKISEGEAWFQVAKDPSRPFVVEAGNVRVRAVGTAFSVRRRDNGADVLVTEGIVEAGTDMPNQPKLRLVAGQQAFIGERSPARVETVQAASVERTLAWREGMIDLSGDPLANAVAEFNRYNRRQLVIVDSRLGVERFDGVFRIDDPVGFATAVKMTLGVPVDFSQSEEIRIGS